MATHHHWFEKHYALSTACDMANDKANQQIVMFSKENIMYSKILNEIDKNMKILSKMDKNFKNQCKAETII